MPIFFYVLQQSPVSGNGEKSRPKMSGIKETGNWLYTTVLQLAQAAKKTSRDNKKCADEISLAHGRGGKTIADKK